MVHAGVMEKMEAARPDASTRATAHRRRTES